MKTCSKCGESKPHDEFHKNKRTKDGLESQCKPCKNQSNKDWVAANKERRSETIKEWKASNPNKQREYQAKYRRTHLEYHCAQSHKRRSKIKSKSVPPLEAAFHIVITKFFQPVCNKCGTQEDLTIDHIVSIHYGGSNSMENFQTLCRSCNASKGAKYADYRLRWLRTCPILP